MGVAKLWSCLLLVGCATESAKDSADPIEDLDSTESDESSDDDDGAEPEGSEESDGSGDAGDSNEDAEEPGDETEEAGCADSWELTYAITGRVDITDTPLGIGNAYANVGGVESDEIVLRIPDDGGVLANGAVVMTSFNLLQDFRVSVEVVGEIAIETYLSSISTDECGVATGQLDGASLEWDECNYGALHGTNEWSPDEGATGSGCIRDYHVEGLVECIDNSVLATCEAGWLDEGENVLDYTYNQPMLTLDFDSADLDSFTMRGSDVGAELPTYTNNRTWLSLEGTLKSMTLEPTPACLCTE